MQINKINHKCGDCFKPTMRRLANFRPKDDYECYAEGYIKLFWGLCDSQKSTHEFHNKSKQEVITNQPKLLTPEALNDVVFTVK